MALIFFDFDSTVCKKETLDTIIERALDTHPDRERLSAEVEAITNLGMEGKIPFLESLERRLAIIPFTKAQVEAVGRECAEHITEGMPEVFEWLRSNGHTPFIISGGFFESILPAAEQLGIDQEHLFANTFDYSSGFAKVAADSLLVTKGKASVIAPLREKYPPQKCIIVGDGMNDWRAVQPGAADMMIGFGANVVREPVKEKCEHFVCSCAQLLEAFKSGSILR